jgi:uncharacterized protein involved in exopolysaccharide biosynthesis
VIEDELRRVPPTIQSYADSDRSQQTQLLTENVARLQAKRRDLASRYNETFPEIESLDRQIQAAQAQIASAPTREGSATRQGANPVYQELQTQAVTLRAQLSGLQARQAQLAVDAAAIDARVRDLNTAATRYRDLLRNRDVLDDSYRAFVKSSEEVQMADSAERGRAANIRVVQPPEATGAPLDIRKLLVAGGVVVGLAAALAVMALLNALRQVFVTPRDVSLALDLPVLAAVTKRGRRSLRRDARQAKSSPLWAEPPASGVIGS